MLAGGAPEQESADRFLPLLERAAGKLLTIADPRRLTQELFALAPRPQFEILGA